VGGWASSLAKRRCPAWEAFGWHGLTGIVPPGPTPTGTAAGGAAVEVDGPATMNCSWDAHLPRSGRGQERWAVQQEEGRNAALQVWITIAEQAGEHSAFAKQLQEVGTVSGEGLAMVSNTFRGTAAATLVKRGRSVARYARWAPACNRNGSPYEDLGVYRYLEQLRCDGAPATRGTSFLEAVPVPIALATWLGLSERS
jgi:hypothetical protein